MNKELILEIIDYIEDREEIIDSEWGAGRSFHKIVEDGEAHELYSKLKELLEGCD